MSKYGGNNIGRMMFGENEIGKAYLGNNLVFSRDVPPTPPTPSNHFLDYITFTQGSWFNTGVKSSKSLRLDVTFMPTTTTAAWMTLLGCRGGSSRDYIVAFGTNTNVYSVIYMATSNNANSTSITSSALFPIIDNSIRIVKSSGASTTFYKNGHSAYTVNITTTSTTASEDIYVGGHNRYDNNSRGEYFIGRVYEVKFDGVTFLPYKKDGVNGFLRMDNNVFYPSAGSDVFGGSTTGPNNVLSTYSYANSELSAFTSLAPISSGTTTIISSVNNRISFGLTSGDAPLLDDNGQASSYYPIPIPNGAKYVYYKISPSSMYSGIRLLSLANGSYTTVRDIGWSMGEGFISIESGSTHITINSKYNEQGNSYPTDYPTEMLVKFYN